MAGGTLGRRLHHDPRSLQYLVPETASPESHFWQRVIPVLDQGNLGSCVGNASTGVLGTAPFFDTLPGDVKAALDEAFAVKIYSSATQFDEWPDTYPPTDSGSSGLGGAKACQAAGLISGYLHITSIPAAQEAIKGGPFIVGVNWWTGMDKPDAAGLAHVTGSIRGGHEFECHGYDAQRDVWWFTNSWGTGWGRQGTFCLSGADFAKLLADQGDATVFVPLTSPAPTPVPVPAAVAFTADQFAAVDAWSRAPHVWSKATAAAKAWKAATVKP